MVSMRRNMMDHIRLRDWCSTSASNQTHFVEERDIDNCVVERIIRNRFWDPLISSDEDEPVRDIDWDSIFKKKSNRQQQHRHLVPGYRKAPPYPKLSALTQKEHVQGVKVLSARNNHILPKEFLGRPMKNDFRVFEENKPIYEKEQQEFLEWAKQLWQSSNCIRALKPKPIVEAVYDAEFKMKAHMIKCFPKAFTMVAQIPLKAENHRCEMILPKTDLIKVDLLKVPKVCYPQIYETKESILRECPLPKPCNQHPTGFQLPNEPKPSILLLTDLHKELAQFGIDNGAEFVASENAIKCLLETDRTWTLPISVCEVIRPGGDKTNVVVLGNEFPDKREPATVRSYRAFKHLLLKAFTSKSSQSKPSDPKTNPQATKNNTPTDKRFKSSSLYKAAVAFNSGVRKVAGCEDLSDDSDDRRVSDDRRASDDSDEEDRLQIDIDENTMIDSQNASEIEDDKPLSEYYNTSNKKNSNAEENPPRKILRARLRKSVDNNSQKTRESSQMDCRDLEESDDELVIDINMSGTDNETNNQNIKENNYEETSKLNTEESNKLENKTSSATNGLNSEEIDSQEVNDQPEQNDIDVSSILECVCEGTDFEKPYPRSYKKVQLRNHSTDDQVNVIVHSSHKLRKDWSSGEVVLEPILEYQLELGGTTPSPQKMQSLAFSLMLRKNADLALVRVDGSCGELVSIEYTDGREVAARHPHCSADAFANTAYTALNQLAGLLPGHYALRHEPSHGANALLYSRARPGAPDSVPLQSPEALSPAEEARLVGVAPKLAPVLLPIHKFHRQLPLSFPYNQKLVARPNPNKVVRKPKLPPAAIQWPKKRGRKKKAKN